MQESRISIELIQLDSNTMITVMGGLENNGTAKHHDNINSALLDLQHRVQHDYNQFSPDSPIKPYMSVYTAETRKRIKDQCERAYNDAIQDVLTALLNNATTSDVTELIENTASQFGIDLDNISDYINSIDI